MATKFELDGEYIELIKLIKLLGITSTGGQAKMLVEHGLVSVDGELESRKRRKIKKGMVVEIKDQETIEVI
jgi:ribosome-associated protein